MNPSLALMDSQGIDRPEDIATRGGNLAGAVMATVGSLSKLQARRRQSEEIELSHP
jgi:hypothetical protein